MSKSPNNPIETELTRLRAMLGREADVRRVLEIEPMPGGRFRYLIETPFDAFPRFVIGTTDARFEDVRPGMRCGAEWNARRAWDERGAE